MTVPLRVRQRLTATLAQWGALDGTPDARLDVIEGRLRRDYRYSVEFDRTDGRDPIVDFIETHKEGHCEYFAAAFVLLARTANVPARVVTGYRVTERSPFGYAIVRERNAHAWVEAYVGDRWVTYDPTPPADLALASRGETPWLAALGDGVATGWESVDDWLGRRSPFELSLLLVGLFAVLLLGRALRERRAKRGPSGPPLDDPLPSFSELAQALSAKGLTREPSETLARFAERVAGTEGLGDETRRAVVSAVTGYARLRYARDADEAQIVAALRRASEAVRAPVTSSASRT